MSNKNLQKIVISEAYRNKILHVGDEVYLLFNPSSKNLDYRYYSCTILSISVISDWNQPDEEVDSVQILDTEGNIVLSNQYRIKFEYYLNNVRQWTSLSMWKDFSKMYLPEEKDILEEDIQHLNEILNMKRKQKQELQEKVNDMLQDWNYRGTIKI